MTKNILFLATLSLILFAVPASLHAQATATGTASVVVEERAITLTAVTPLNFGTVLAFGRAGSVTVSYTGTTSASSAHSSAPGTPGTFTATGVPNAPYALTLPANGAVTVSNGTESMTLRSFTRTGSTSQLYFDAAGDASFSVGATLDVGARQPQGTYTGTYDVTIDYN